jgi:PleD family two-component response regulator
MITADKPWRPFMVLTASSTEVGERALHSVLRDRGYAVLSADTGHKALELAGNSAPDAVLLDWALSDASGVEVCRHLSGNPLFGPTLPIILLSSHGNSREDRHIALSAGAWDLCSEPLDGEALLLKLEVFLRARQAAERMRQGCLLERATGLYTMDGLQWRASELGADARRRREALACIAFAPLLRGQPVLELADPVARHLANTWRRHTRASDVLGRIYTNEFALLAPATDAKGATRMIERLRELLSGIASSEGGEWTAIGVRARYSATPNYAESPLGAIEMLLNAATALHDDGNRDAVPLIEEDLSNDRLW